MKQEARKDWLFEKYSCEELIIIDSDDDDDDDETLAGFTPSHIDNKKNSFWTSLASLMQRALQWFEELLCVYVILNDGWHVCFNFSGVWGHIVNISVLYNPSSIKTGLP